MQSLYYSILIWAYTYGGLLLPFATAGLGACILATKEKYTKWLGAWFLSIGLCYFVQHLYNMLPRYVGVKTIIALSFPKSCVAAALTVLALISVFLYAKFRYEAKGLLAVILLILAKPIVIVPLILNQGSIINSASSASVFSNLTSFLSALPGIAIWIMLVLIYRKNRDKEDNMGALWTHPLCVLFFEIFFEIFNLVGVFGGETSFLLSMHVTIANYVMLTAYAAYVFARAPKKTEKAS